MSMAGGTLFQMDQTKFTDQEILWHLRECGQNPNLDRDINLCYRSDYEKEIEYRVITLHNFTNFECDHFRKNAHFKSAGNGSLQYH